MNNIKYTEPQASQHMLSGISSRDRLNSLVMLSRASRYAFQNGSGLCIKTTSETMSKNISEMTFREKR